MSLFRNITFILVLGLFCLVISGCGTCRVKPSRAHTGESSKLTLNLEGVPLQGCYSFYLEGSDPTYFLVGRVASVADSEAIERAARIQFPIYTIHNALTIDGSLLPSQVAASYSDPYLTPLDEVREDLITVIKRNIPEERQIFFELSVARTLSITGNLPSYQIADRLVSECEQIQGVGTIRTELTVDGNRYIHEDRAYRLQALCTQGGAAV